MASMPPQSFIKGMPKKPEFMNTRGGTVLRMSSLPSLAQRIAVPKRSTHTKAEALAISAMAWPVRLLSVREMKMRAGKKKSEATFTKSCTSREYSALNRYPPRTTNRIGSICKNDVSSMRGTIGESPIACKHFESRFPHRWMKGCRESSPWQKNLPLANTVLDSRSSSDILKPPQWCKEHHA